MGLEGLTGQSCLSKKLGLLLSPGHVENKGLIVPSIRWVGRDSNGMSWTDCMLVIVDRGVRVGKGTRGGEFLITGHMEESPYRYDWV